jgi:hypothetical protein
MKASLDLNNDVWSIEHALVRSEVSYARRKKAEKLVLKKLKASCGVQEDSGDEESLNIPDQVSK